MRPSLLAVLCLSLCCASTERANESTSVGVLAPAPVEGLIEIGDISEALVVPVLKKFDERVEAGDKTINFRIDSFGGDIFLGMDFIQHVEDSARRNDLHVKCYVDKAAMSMGLVILESICDERFMTKRSVLLAHNGSAGARGTADEMGQQVEFLRALNVAMSEVVGSRLKIGVEAYRAKIAHGDWVFTWEEALAVGAVDAVVDPRDIPVAYVLDAPETNPFQLLLGEKG